MTPRLPPNGQDYLTPEETIVLLRLRGRQQFYRLVREGHLPAVRLGRLIRVPRKSLDACLSVAGRVCRMPKSSMNQTYPQTTTCASATRLPASELEH